MYRFLVKDGPTIRIHEMPDIHAEVIARLDTTDNRLDAVTTNYSENLLGLTTDLNRIIRQITNVEKTRFEQEEAIIDLSGKVSEAIERCEQLRGELTRVAAVTSTVPETPEALAQIYARVAEHRATTEARLSMIEATQSSAIIGPDVQLRLEAAERRLEASERRHQLELTRLEIRIAALEKSLTPAAASQRYAKKSVETEGKR